MCCMKRIFTCLMYGICIFTTITAIGFMSAGAALAAGLEDYLNDVLTYLVEIPDDDDLARGLYMGAVYLMLAVGSMLFFTAVVGCLGACCHSQCYLLLFNITTGVIVVMALVSGGLAIGFKSTLKDNEVYIRANFTNQVMNVYGVGDQSVTDSWDKMQSQLGCCGSVEYGDWKNSAYFTDTRNEVPPSCCVRQNDDDFNFEDCKAQANTTSPNQDILFEQGCQFKFEDDVRTNADILTGLSLSFGILNLIAVIAGCCLKSKIEDEQS